jgi:hypothetical protein
VGADGADPLADIPLDDIANTLSCGLSLWLWHLGHLGLSRPKTRISNSCWHSWQMYSKIGMLIAPLERTPAIRINLWELRKRTSQNYFANRAVTPDPFQFKS